MMRNIVINLFLLLLMGSCRQDELVSFVEETPTGGLPSTNGIVGLYVLCEGNMGSNKCTLDYLDLSQRDGAETSHYLRNVYGDRNPSSVMELGDVGNDIGIYGSKLWMVINCSNKVEVCEAATARRVGQIDIANCRYLAFEGGYAYVSSYAGPVQIGEHCPLGRVYKVDTFTLQKVDSLTVGYQPEEMAVSGEYLYVANSGGYRVPQYDNRISVIHLPSFTKTADIEVAINLHRLVADLQGTLWVSSRGDYFDHPSQLHWIAADGSQGVIARSVSAMQLVGDSLYCIGSAFNYATGSNDKSFFLVNVRDRAVVDTHLFDSPALASIALPYGIAVNPIDRDFYLMDATNYVTSGRLLHFLSDGTFDWEVATGDIPSRAVFLRKSCEQ